MAFKKNVRIMLWWVKTGQVRQCQELGSALQVQQAAMGASHDGRLWR